MSSSSRRHSKLRIQFTQNHQNWTIEYWKNIWSDELLFLLRHSDGRRIFCCYTFKPKQKGSAMYSVKVLLLISFIVPSQTEMHSLYYMYSVISKSLMSGEMFEFHTSVELNDIQMSLCHSVNKADFMTQLCEESERLFNESEDLHYKQQWLQINLKTLMRMMMEHERNNSTRDTDLHVLQWRHGCAVERHSNGSVMFLQGTDEYAYDGQTLTFDLSNQSLVLDHDIIWNRESVSSLERKCVETLTSFTELQRERKFIMKSRPDVHTLVKASGSSVKQLLVCLATGFYPKHVQMEIRHNQTPLSDEQLKSDGIRPNADGSFQLMKSLEILPSETSQYQCVVKHQTDETKYFFIDSIYPAKHKDGSMVVPLDVVIGAVPCILIVFLIIIFTIVFSYYQEIKSVKTSKEQDTLKTPSLQLSALHKTQMKPELLEESRAERCADLTDALNDSDDENTTDPRMEEEHTEEVHDTQSLCDTEATPAAARGAMGSKIISLPNFAMEREDTDQNTVTQNVLLLPLPRCWRSKDISLPNLV